MALQQALALPRFQDPESLRVLTRARLLHQGELKLRLGNLVCGMLPGLRQWGAADTSCMYRLHR